MILTKADDRLEEILAAAEAKIAADGYDAGTVLAAALEGLAECWAEDVRALCPSCAKRRVNRKGSLCTQCEWQAELQLEHKLRWWNAHGDAERRARRRTARPDG